MNNKHGMRYTSEYVAWFNMKQRCKPDYKQSKDYFERGIVCKSFDKFDDFYKELGPRPEGMTLDRIDNNGNYEPGNVRWASRATQKQNSRGTSNSSSRFKGVWLERSTGKWLAKVQREGMAAVYLGRFIKEEDAARAYDKAALKIYGSDMHLNFDINKNGENQMKINYAQILSDFGKRHGIEDFEDRPVSGLMYLSILGEKIQEIAETSTEIHDLFAKRNLGNIMLECPKCATPVLLEMQHCPVCHANLMGGETEVQSVPTKVETVQDEELDQTPAPKKAKKKVESKPFKKVSEPVVVEDQPKKASYRRLPTDEEVEAAGDKELTKMISDYHLSVNKSAFKKLTPFRVAVMAAVETLREAMTNPRKTEPAPEPVQAKAKKSPAKAKSAVAGDGPSDGKASKDDLGSGAGKPKKVKTKTPEPEADPLAEEEVVDDEPLDEIDSDMDFEEPSEDEISEDSEDEAEDDDFEIDTDNLGEAEDDDMTLDIDEDDFDDE